MAQLSGKECQEFIGAFDYALVEVAQARQRLMDERLRATLDRIVLSAPRQYVLMLGEMVISEWEALNEPPGWQLSDSRNGRD